MRKVFSRLVLAALILLLVSCPSPSKNSGGSLTINLPLITMQLGKNPDLTVASFYDVSGSGPGNASFQKPGITDTSVTIDSLAPGGWGVTVNGNNAKGMQVESASVQVTVVDRETASANVAVSTSVSNGSLELSMAWPVSFSISSVSLTPQGSASQPLTLPATAGTSSIHATTAVPAGYYTLSRVFKDSTGFTSGGADAVQITSGSKTSFDLTVDASGVSLTITPDISNNTAITFSDPKSVLGQGEDVTVTAKLLASAKKISYQWYLNGVLQSELSPTITFPKKTLSSGDYRLDVVISVNGALCSNHVIFKIAGN